MSIAQALLPEFDQEMVSMRKMLERLPEDKLDWAPDAKSMSMGRLAAHIAEMVGWLAMTIEKDQIDFASGDYHPVTAESQAHVVALLDGNVKASRAALEGASDEVLMKPWTLRAGPQILMTMPKIAIIRVMVLNHCIHHRGQLSVYYRMNGVKIPALYGPSADENPFAPAAEAASN